MQMAISIHALLAESDINKKKNQPDKSFLSTLSLRRATEKVPADVYYQAFLSTLSLRRATRSRGGYITKIDISIHALLAESDRFQGLQEQLF